MKAKIEKFNIPEEVTYVTETLKKSGFEAYLVGGCVRDLLWDENQKIGILQQTLFRKRSFPYSLKLL